MFSISYMPIKCTICMFGSYGLKQEVLPNKIWLEDMGKEKEGETCFRVNTGFPRCKLAEKRREARKRHI